MSWLPTIAAMVHQFPATEVAKFEVDMAAGSVTVVAEQRNDAIVEISPARDSKAHRRAVEEVTVKFTNGHLHVSLSNTDNRTAVLRLPPKINVTARIPAGGKVVVNAATADVSTTGRLSRVEVNTVSSRVDVLVEPGTILNSDMSKILGRVTIDPEILVTKHRADATQVVEVNAVRGRVSIATIH